MKRAVVEERFDYKGYSCIVIMQALCFRTGYVGIPVDSKFYGKNYDDLFFIDCHGGLTYSEKTLYEQNDMDKWWIGFDTGHCFDGKDFEVAKKLFADDAEIMKMILYTEEMEKHFSFTEPIRDLEYCKNECRSIVDQIESQSEVTNE